MLKIISLFSNIYHQVAIAGNNVKRTTVVRVRLANSRITSGATRWLIQTQKITRIPTKTVVATHKLLDSQTKTKAIKATDRITTNKNKFPSQALMYLNLWATTKVVTIMATRMDTMAKMDMVNNAHITVSIKLIYLFSILLYSRYFSFHQSMPRLIEYVNKF